MPGTSSGPGLYDAAGNVFYLRDTTTTGMCDEADTITNAPSTATLPVAGDFSGTGVTTVGLYDPTTSIFYLRTDTGSGPANLVIPFGQPNAGWLPIAGDWTGGGTDTIGLYDPTASHFYLRDTNTSGYADVNFAYGQPGGGWLPIVGKWTGGLADGVGLYNPANSVFYLKNSFTGPYADTAVAYGAREPVAPHRRQLDRQRHRYHRHVRSRELGVLPPRQQYHGRGRHHVRLRCAGGQLAAGGRRLGLERLFADCGGGRDPARRHHAHQHRPDPAGDQCGHRRLGRGGCRPRPWPPCSRPSSCWPISAARPSP